jgi:hypothetical protein
MYIYGSVLGRVTEAMTEGVHMHCTLSAGAAVGLQVQRLVCGEG